MNMRKMGENIRTYFSITANQKAGETQFVRGESEMSGSVFLMTLVSGLSDSSQSSLSDLCVFCEEHSDISITAQGADERIS